jgi:hypothetical protein
MSDFASNRRLHATLDLEEKRTLAALITQPCFPGQIKG